MAGAESCPPSFEGPIPFQYEGETFHTYVKIYGNIKDSRRNPLVALHGGPGLSHDYLVPLSDLALNYGIPVITYDQIGNARSTHLKDKLPSFWTIDLFIDELENVLKHFAISDAFDLYGHSWGGVLGLEYEVRRQPQGLGKFVSASSLASFSLWMQSSIELAQTLPPDVGAGLAVGMNDPKKYWEALQVFHAAYGCTVKPIPQQYFDSILWIFGDHGDPTVANAPILKDWSIVDRLHLVRIPVLMMNGRKDIAQGYVVKPLFDGIKKVKWVTFEKSSHMLHMEERERFMQLVAEFLL